MITARISCINKTEGTSAWERIKSVGGVNPDGGRWKLPLNEAIVGIENKTYALFVERPAGDRVNLVVAKSAAGNKYLKTTADGDQPNNLLSLPEWP